MFHRWGIPGARATLTGEYRLPAELLGVPERARVLDPRRALADWLRELIADTGGPVTLEHFGLGHADVPELVDRTVTQTRLLACTPRPVGRDELTKIFETSLSG